MSVEQDRIHKHHRQEMERLMKVAKGKYVYVHKFSNLNKKDYGENC